MISQLPMWPVIIMIPLPLDKAVSRCCFPSTFTLFLISSSLMYAYRTVSTRISAWFINTFSTRSRTCANPSAERIWMPATFRWNGSKKKARTAKKRNRVMMRTYGRNLTRARTRSDARYLISWSMDLSGFMLSSFLIVFALPRQIPCP